MLKSGSRRWSSPLKWADEEEFRRMPRFEPSLSDAWKRLPRTLLDIALGRVGCDRAGLISKARLLVKAATVMLNSGHSEQGLLELWDRDLGDPDTKLEQELLAFFTKSLETARVFCVTDSVANEHMWDRYADQGRGCVLEFRHVPMLDTPLVTAQPVRYSDEGPRIDGALDFLLCGGTWELRKEILNAVCLSKGRIYEAEQEWRVVTWAREEESGLQADYPFVAAELVSVIVGPNFDFDHLPELRTVLRARYAHSSLLRMQASLDACALVQLAAADHVR